MQQQLPISRIDLIPPDIKGDGLTVLKPGTVEQFKDSIELQASLGHGYEGLLTPLKVYARREGVAERYYLLDGEYRITACQLLGFERVMVEIYRDLTSWDHALLIRVHSNLGKDRSVIEKGELLLQHDQILSAIGRRATAGDNQNTVAAASVAAAPLWTNQEIASEYDISPRSQRLYKQVARALHPQIKAEVQGTEIENQVTVLLKAAQAGESYQKQRSYLEQYGLERKERQQRQEQQEQQQLPQAENVVAFERRAKAVKVGRGEWWRLGNGHRIFSGEASGEFLESPSSKLAIAQLDDPSGPALDIESEILAIPIQADRIWEYTRSEGPQDEAMLRQYWLKSGKKPQQTILVMLFGELDAVQAQAQPLEVSSIDQVYLDLITSLVGVNESVVVPFASSAILDAVERQRGFCIMAAGQEAQTLIEGWIGHGHRATAIRKSA